MLGLAEPLAEAEELTSEFRGYRECTAFSGKIAIVGFGKMGALHATILKMLSPEGDQIKAPGERSEPGDTGNMAGPGRL